MYALQVSCVSAPSECNLIKDSKFLYIDLEYRLKGERETTKKRYVKNVNGKMKCVQFYPFALPRTLHCSPMWLDCHVIKIWNLIKQILLNSDECSPFCVQTMNS